jgi:serine protease Do
MPQFLSHRLVTLSLVGINLVSLAWHDSLSMRTIANPVWLANQTGTFEGQQINYSGSFANLTRNKTGTVAINILFEKNNKISGYINFTNIPGEAVLCGAGNFQGVIRDRLIQLRFISNDPDQGCGWDKGLAFVVQATLSPDGSQLENGAYVINNSQGGRFLATALNRPRINPQPQAIVTFPVPKPVPPIRSATNPPVAPATSTPVAANSSPVNVYRIANQTTVRIDGQAPGSGVIISRVGNTYYVLTAKHVVATPDEYTVVTSNGKRFPINYNQVRKLEKLDLAVVQFTSSESFAIAQLGNSEQVNPGENVFVSGWPKDLSTPSQQTTDGRITGFQRGDAKGYELVYGNSTGPGMSGGPVFDTSGRVVGIHGQGANNQEVGKIGINMGIPIHLFLLQAPQAGLNLQQLGLRSQL